LLAQNLDLNFTALKIFKGKAIALEALAEFLAQFTAIGFFR
jgi:hypothetical protein